MDGSRSSTTWPTGHTARMPASTQFNATSTQNSSPNKSGTGLQTLRPPSGSSSIPSRSGAAGAVGKLNGGPKPTDDPETTDRLLVASLKQLLPSSLAIARVSSIDPVYGWDSYPCVTGKTTDDVGPALALLAPYTEPGDFEQRARALGKLRALTTRRADDAMDAQLLLEAMAEALSEYPADVFGEACRKWSRCEKWFPTESELRAVCDRLYRNRKSLVSSLKGAAR